MNKKAQRLRIMIPEQFSNTGKLEKGLRRFFKAEDSSSISGNGRSTISIEGIPGNISWCRQVAIAKKLAKRLDLSSHHIKSTGESGGLFTIKLGPSCSRQLFSREISA